MNNRMLQTVIRLQDNISRPLRGIRNNLEQFGRSVNENNNRLRNLTNGMKTVGKAGVVAGGAIVASVGGAFVYSTKKAIEFESAFAGVKKTLNTDGMSGAQVKKTLDGISKGLIELSNHMPQSASELAGIAESAGQLGIETPNILSFTKTMAMLGDTTNMTSEEAGTNFARFANIVGMSQGDFDRLGSVVVDLGNNLATTEQEITAMALRLAGAGSQVGMLPDQIFALSGALSSVGIEAESGGSSFSKLISQMQLSVETGKGNLNKFAKVSGMTAKQFQKAFKDDASGALTEFIKGLGNVKRNGKSTTEVLDDMGIKEIRMTDALKRASGASAVFEKSMKIGSKAWKENNALAKEAEQRYGTTESALKIMKNQIDNASIKIGNAFLPVIRDATEWVGKIAKKFSDLSPNMKKTIITVGLVALGIGGLLLVGGGLLIFFSTLAGVIASSSLAMAILTSPITLIVGGFLILGGILLYAYNHCKKFRDGVNELGRKLKEMAEPIINYVSPILKDLWEKIKELAKSFKPLLDAIMDFAGVLLPVLAPVIAFILGFFVLKFIFAFTLLSEKVKAVVEAITGVIKGIADFIKGFVDFLVGGFTNDNERVTKGVELMWKGMGQIIKSIWEGLINFLSAPIEAVVKILDALFKDKAEGIRKTWDKIKEWLKHPIKGTVDIIKNVFGGGGDSKAKAKPKATTPKKTGPKRKNAFGLNRVSKNDELHRLHQGERVLTKQESNQYDKKSNGGVIINMHGTVIREEADIKKIAKALVFELNNQRISFGGDFS